ncbi:MAG: hypothetical protein ACJASK_000982, partial [Ilumatobacter sp.]
MSRHGIAVASVVVAALAVAACGGGSESVGTNPPNDPAVTFATVPEPQESSAESEATA